MPRRSLAAGEAAGDLILEGALKRVHAMHAFASKPESSSKKQCLALWQVLFASFAALVHDLGGGLGLGSELWIAGRVDFRP